ncbi:MAG TPA: GGDEF domain-containing protein, partial [Pseudomonas sp.]|nr:GGDEF domain-containing protein [Pseudomonas sp.]
DFVESAEELLDLADKRMYLAKTSGRNRLCFEAPGEIPSETPLSAA